MHSVSACLRDVVRITGVNAQNDLMKLGPTIVPDTRIERSLLEPLTQASGEHAGMNPKEADFL